MEEGSAEGMISLKKYLDSVNDVSMEDYESEEKGIFAATVQTIRSCLRWRVGRYQVETLRTHDRSQRPSTMPSSSKQSCGERQ